MAKMKGSAFTARFEYLAKTYPERYQAILDRLQPATRALADSRLLKNEWYPFDAFVDLVEAADAVVGDGSLALSRTLGAHAAEVNLPTIYKLFYKVGSPEYILNKAATLWSVHHDTGSAKLVRLEPNHVEYQIHGFERPHRALCLSLQGFIEKSLELTGVDDVQVHERQCAAEGAEYCAFQGRWRD
jgi:predicted hydrocarbon binding protein